MITLKKLLYLSISVLFILFLVTFLIAGNKTDSPTPLQTQLICVPSGNFSTQPNVQFSIPSHLIEVRHLPTPKYVKSLYMTGWVAGIPQWRNKLVALANESDINSIIIDVKDYSGKLSFITGNPELAALGVEESRIKDLKAFLDYCHDHGIYTIARITVFQDPEFAKRYPQFAVQTSAGKTWKDRKGLAYIDPMAKPFWDYIITIALASYEMGFDEINFDYIRFPTDGNMQDMKFPISGKVGQGLSRTTSNVTTIPHTKAWALEQFFSYLSTHMRAKKIPTSADLFGMVLTANDDLNIGQSLEITAPYFDYICPMIYPSHYPRGFLNFSNPSEHPYEIIHHVLERGAERLEKIGYPRTILRPWLQDFNLGSVYDAKKVGAQIQAAQALGITSWFMWDPRVKYISTSAFSRGKNN